VPYFFIILSIIIPAYWSPGLNPAGGSPTDPCGCFNFVGLEVFSALTLFVFGVLADNHDLSFALDYLALFAHGFY